MPQNDLANSVHVMSDNTRVGLLGIKSGDFGTGAGIMKPKLELDALRADNCICTPENLHGMRKSGPFQEQ